jgi:hypothetical protein
MSTKRCRTYSDVRAIYECRFAGRTTKAQRAHALDAVSGCTDVDNMPDMTALVLRGEIILACPRCIVP